jgi:hypothetical protein
MYNNLDFFNVVANDAVTQYTLYIDQPVVK